MVLPENRTFTKKQIEEKLNNCIGKTLLEVDCKHVFSRKSHKGIAGAVIEQSVLGYPANNLDEPDIEVDGVPTEVKTTGIRRSKKDSATYEAKEPVSVTAVIPETIDKTGFEESNFWSKISHLLLVYYLYENDSVSQAKYEEFPIKGYQFKEFTGQDKELLKHDWTIVRDFIKEIHRRSKTKKEAESQYPMISSQLNRQKLTVIDTAPKWPNRPRFRLKRKFVSTIVNEYFGARYDTLPTAYASFESIDCKCKELTRKYQGKTVCELSTMLHVDGVESKQSCERIIVRMFGGHARRMADVELFAKFSIIGKSVVLTRKGERTEDMKLFPIDFEELQNSEVSFEESTFRANFSEPQMLCFVFEEPNKSAPLKENVFLGFKRLVFGDDFIENEVRPIWDEIRMKLINHELRSTPVLTKNGQKRYNKKTHTCMESVNLPKSKDHNVFCRGTGKDSRDKKLIIDGQEMYYQNIWIKGSYIAQMLSEVQFLK